MQTKFVHLNFVECKMCVRQSGVEANFRCDQLWRPVCGFERELAKDDKRTSRPSKAKSKDKISVQARTSVST